ncbi:conserved hypothetical protein [Ricinus communis]|uniref:Reverse transcriptase zinc-binding domain-containing protein n=1 Tax=Ricinus communis TaxID=3988 RepID=B9RZ50_RICCO|nr:conserved hypothetical protein [Ricinus communis]
MHLLSWDKICKPKSRGGLGLREAVDFNTIMLMKLEWKYLLQQEALWAQIFCVQYVLAGISWSVENVMKIRFWNDNWVEEEEESSIHSVKDCPFAMHIWCKFMSHDIWLRFSSLSLHEWIDRNLVNKTSLLCGKHKWNLIFGVTAWHLW